MKNTAITVKGVLSSIIAKMAQSPQQYVKNPESDFTRKRSLSFETVMKFIISMGGNSIYKELLEAQDYSTETVSSSAFVQQRDKILPSAFEFLFRSFTDTHTVIELFSGYRLFAFDGSDLRIPTNPNDPETYTQNKPDTKGYNHLHLNALYDLQNRIYVDAIIQPRMMINEHKALVETVERSQVNDKVILIADRGLESYNNFAHIEQKGWNYVIRVKDLRSNGILSGLSLPSDGEFDINFDLILTKKHTKTVRENRGIYKFISSTAKFDFLDNTSNLFYPMSFRVVRIRLDNGSYETLITNLCESEFSPSELKHIYKLRWGIETSFRELKYTIGLTSFHAKKRESIIQEIFARMTMYNFTAIITSHVIIEKSDKKHDYKINFTIAVHICRRFIRFYGNEPPLDVEALIRKNIVPLRPIRKNRYDRGKIRSKSFVSFVYRVA